jgi:hypothetical protein
MSKNLADIFYDPKVGLLSFDKFRASSPFLMSTFSFPFNDHIIKMAEKVIEHLRQSIVERDGIFETCKDSVEGIETIMLKLIQMYAKTKKNTKQKKIH